MIFLKIVFQLVLLFVCNVATNRVKRIAQLNLEPHLSPRAYICVQIGSCIAVFNDTYNIDPRIDGNGASCPFGQEPCYPQQSSPLCGTRFIYTLDTSDGVSSFGAHPWQAYIMNQTSFTGSGVLIDPYHVLTAAHKVSSNLNTPWNIRVYLGVWDPTAMTGTQNFTASRIILHPNFETVTLRNDIAILRLSSPAVLGLQVNVGTACLPEQNFSYVGRLCRVSGWGQSAFGAFDAPRKTQYQINVPIVDYVTCRISMSQPHVLGSSTDRFLDSLGELCAGGRAQLDACTQDGGAPLICQSETNSRFYIAGLVAWGKRCGEPGVYGVYVNVSYYINWINQIISMLNSEF